MGAARVRWCGCKSLREEEEMGGGARPRARGNGGGCTRGGDWGRAARVKGRLMGRIKIHGPTRPRDSPRPRRKRLTKEILLSYW
jgi:hypothetical protein